MRFNAIKRKICEICGICVRHRLRQCTHLAGFVWRCGEKEKGSKIWSLFCGQGQIRTAEAVRQQIYSLPVLTTYLPTRAYLAMQR